MTVIQMAVYTMWGARHGAEGRGGGRREQCRGLGMGRAKSSFTLHQFCSPYAMYSRDERKHVIRHLGIHIYTRAAKEQLQRCSGRQMCCLHITYCLCCGPQPLSSSTPLALCDSGLPGLFSVCLICFVDGYVLLWNVPLTLPGNRNFSVDCRCYRDGALVRCTVRKVR